MFYILLSYFRLQSERVGKDKMRASDPMPNIMLSVKDEVDNINSVPTRTLREMFDSAASLTNEDGNVVPLPGSKDGKIYIVANNIKPTDPFMVKFAPSTVTAACENKCARWMGFKICEHTIAVVSVLGNLKNYLKSFKKQEEKRGNTSNITKLVNVNMPANRLSFQIDFHCKSRKSSL